MGHATSPPRRPARGARLVAAVVQGVDAGLFAGIPQVLLAQAGAVLLDLPRRHADIGPRFVQRVAWRLGESPSKAVHWAVAGAFHFVYAAWWGALDGLLQGYRPVPPLAAGPLLGALIYMLAFSLWGAATQTGTERPPERHRARETLLHWTAALSFSLSTAFAYRGSSATEPTTGLS